MKNIYLVTRDDLTEANSAVFARLKRHLPAITSDPALADAIFVFGGDGTMLKAVRGLKDYGIPFCGFNFGHIGFLMNDPKVKILKEILVGSLDFITVRLLEADIYNAEGARLKSEFAFNDFYFERATTQTAKIRITVNGKVRFNPLICDGVIVATSAGSTAYTGAAGGIVVPVGTSSLVLTGISPALFHHWRSSQLHEDVHITLEAIETTQRPVRFIADNVEVPGVIRAEVRYTDMNVRLGFARSQNFQEKVFALQFNS